MLEDERDMASVVGGLRLVDRLFAAEPLACFVAPESPYLGKSDEVLIEIARQAVGLGIRSAHAEWGATRSR